MSISRFENEIIAKNNEFESKESTLGKVKEAHKEFKEKVKKSNYLVQNLLFGIFFGLITLILLGFTSLIQGEYDISKILTLKFLINWSIVQLATWFVRVWVTIMKKRHLRLNDPTYLRVKGNINKHIENDDKEPFIDKNAKIDDYNRKLKAFTIKQKVKILSIAVKYQIDNLMGRLNNVDTFEEFKLETKLKLSVRKQTKINAKLNILLRTLSSEWLKVNLDTQKVKYNEVSKSILVTGHKTINENQEGLSYTSNKVKNLFVMNMGGFIFSIIFLLVIQPILGSTLTGDIDAWISFLTNVFLVAFAAAMSLYNSDELFMEDEVKPLINVDTTLNEYWNLTKGK